MTGHNGITGADIQLLGTKFEIKDLEPNQRYFLRRALHRR